MYISINKYYVILNITIINVFIQIITFIRLYVCIFKTSPFAHKHTYVYVLKCMCVKMLICILNAYTSV